MGQSEIEIAAVADPTVVILNPGAGDAIQAAKAGVLEVADIVVVNKADRDGAEQTVRDLRAETDAPIISLIADRGEGIAELMAAIEDHHRTDSRARRLARARAQILSLAQTRLRSRPDLDRLAEAVVDGDRDPYSAAERLLSPTPGSRTNGFACPRSGNRDSSRLRTDRRRPGRANLPTLILCPTARSAMS